MNSETEKIHPSHKMTEWQSTIVTILSTPRFGRVRECEYCGAGEAESVCGHVMDGDLKRPCFDAPGGE